MTIVEHAVEQLRRICRVNAADIIIEAPHNRCLAGLHVHYGDSDDDECLAAPEFWEKYERLKKAVTEGRNVADVAEDIRGIYGDWGESRISFLFMDKPDWLPDHPDIFE
ncbi:MAG TPA: hypothetical protein VLA04_00465 [Verrucomicrobiae bacterium]|nr:hypothetical protein [Verrucomicrobiae bacterium]